MDEVLRSLGGLLLEAIPTFLLVVLLHLYLKRVFFRPMGEVLAKRYAATEGARKSAEESLKKAAEKAAEYENSVRIARGEIFKEQEGFRKKLREDQARAIEEARKHAATVVADAGGQLAQELEAAKQALTAQTESLAGSIVESVLHRRPA